MELGVHPFHELFKHLGLDHDADWSEVVDVLDAALRGESAPCPAIVPTSASIPMMARLLSERALSDSISWEHHHDKP